MTVIINPYVLAVVGGAFTPASLSNCQLYVAADSLSLIDNDKIATWTDQSGNARHLTQTGADILKPVFKTNIINSLPAVKFDIANGTFFNVGTWMDGYTEIEMFVLYKWINLGGTSAPSMHNITGGSGTYQPFWADSKFYEGFGSNTRRDAITGSVAADTQFRAYNVQSASGAYNIRQNNTSIFTSATNTVSTGSGTRKFGTNGGQFSDMYVLELVIYNGAAKDSTDRTSIMNFWNTKYGLTI